MTKKIGTLYGVGVGPGEPELITVKALRTIERCGCAVIPAGQRERCRAYKIAAQMTDMEKKELLAFDFPMTRDAEELERRIGEFFEEIAAVLDRGVSAAFLTIGDPSLYSTFSAVAHLAANRGYPVEVVAGVSSVSACAGALNVPLTEREESLHIFSGDTDYREAVKLAGTKVFMKTGRSVTRLKTTLRDREKAGQIDVYAVKDCGGAQEIFHGADAIPDEPYYMMTVIVKDRR